MQNLKYCFLGLLLFSMLAAGRSAHAQSDVDVFLKEGNKRFEEQRYSAALSFYQQAESKAPKNAAVLYHIGRVFFYMENYKETIYYSETLIKEHPKHPLSQEGYFLWGWALERQGHATKAMATYKQGLKQFPDFFKLHFRSGILLLEQQKGTEALAAFEQTALLKPSYSNAHLSIAIITKEQGNRVASILAFSTFLLLEPTGKRALEALETLEELLQAPSSQEGEAFPASFESWLNEQPLPDSLTATERIDYFHAMYDTLCQSLADTPQKNRSKAFFWSFYAPLWIDMQQADFISSIAHIIFASRQEEALRTWLRENEAQYSRLYDWLAAYEWN